MATYKEVKGVTVQTLDSDPVVFEGSWSAGGNMNTARELLASAGTVHTASLVSGGYNGSTHVANVEQYDGTSWTEVADLNTGRYYITGFGSSTAAIACGGTPPVTTKTELWNGSAWTEVNDLTRGPSSPQATAYMMSSGASTSGLVYGGDEGATNKSALTESWDGTNWTEVGDLNTGRSYGAGSGTTNTAALCLSGFNWTPGIGGSPLVEQYNGSSWTEVGDVNSGRGRQAASNYGGVSTTIMFGGSPNNSSLVGNTESWDGSSWTEVNDLGTARWGLGGSGNATSALAFGGAAPSSSRLSATEEWTFPPVTAATLNEGSIFLSGGTTLKGFGKAAGIPAASFSAGGSLNTSRGYMAGCGTQTAGSVFGGSPYNPPTNKSQLHEQYDGSSWTETTDTNSGHSAGSASTKGTQTAVIVFTGGPPPSGVKTEQWNGSSWTEVNDLSTSRNNGPAGFGVQTSAICCGGNNPPITTTESWDGTSWTAVNSMNGGRRNFAGCGPSTAGIVAGGQGPGGTVDSSETWDGTSWTETNNLNSSRRGVTLFGNDSSSAFCTGGGSSANNEFWNGTSWTELNNLATARNDSGAGGSSVAGFVAGGPQSGGDATEEWTADNTLSNVTLS